MAQRDEILEYAAELLDLDSFRDYGPQGMQVAGAEDVSRIVCAVSSSLELFERAAAAGAQLVIVHHGLFWDGEPRVIDARMRRRLEALFEADLTLAGYHLALDAHPEVGNNALLAGLLGCERHEAFAKIGRLGEFAGDGIAAGDLLARVREVTQREPLVFDAGPERVRRIGIVSGSASKLLPQAVELGLDAFLTGEPAENVMADAREAGIHFIAAGHYATETFGVRRLGELLAEHFGIVHQFVDIPNPV